MSIYSFNTDNLNSENSLLIEGIPVADLNGTQSASLTLAPDDFNGDGISEILIQPLSFDGSRIFAILGSDSLPDSLNLANFDASNGFTIDGATFFATFSDFNGDGIQDLAYNVFDLAFGGSRVAVILGSEELPATFDVNNLEATNGFSVSAESPVLASGVFEPDLNNDGIDDFIVATENLSGDVVTQVIFGRSDYPTDFVIPSLDGSNGFQVNGSGLAVGTSFDFNNDGFDDLIFNNLEEQAQNSIDVVLGNSEFPPELNLGSLTAEQGFTITQQNAVGSDLVGSFIEDINGDGISDIVVQTNPDSDSQGGQVAVVYGNSNPDFTTIDISNIDGTNGFIIGSTEELQAARESTPVSLDLNGDNLQDLVIKNTTSDRVYVIFGSNNIPNNLDLETLKGTDGFVITNPELTPGIVGDINGDGLDDLTLDTPIGDDTRYILLGSQEEYGGALALNADNANVLELSGDRTVNGITGLSDVNGDGADDILFGSVIDPEDGTVASSGILFGDSELSFADSNLAETPDEEPDDGSDDGNNGSETETTELFRFRNTTFASGTYVFVGEAERNSILDDNNLSNTFSLDGEQNDGSVNAAFKASLEPGEDLIPFFRLKSLDLPGTFLFVSTPEYDAIFATDSDQRDKWEREGLGDDGEDIPEFYLLDGSADRGVEFNRFQNNDNGTFLYAGPDETAAIESDPSLSALFTNQGVAFESLV